MALFNFGLPSCMVHTATWGIIMMKGILFAFAAVTSSTAKAEELALDCHVTQTYGSSVYVEHLDIDDLGVNTIVNGDRYYYENKSRRYFRKTSSEISFGTIKSNGDVWIATTIDRNTGDYVTISDGKTIQRGTCEKAKVEHKF